MLLGSKNHKTVDREEETEGGKHGRMGTGGVHNPSNRLPAGERHQSVIPPFRFIPALAFTIDRVTCVC